MVKMINKRTGTAFWVAEDRVEEYKAAGHKLAASLNTPKLKEVAKEVTEAVVEEIAEEAPKPKKKPVSRAKKR